MVTQHFFVFVSHAVRVDFAKLEYRQYARDVEVQLHRAKRCRMERREHLSSVRSRIVWWFGRGYEAVLSHNKNASLP